MVTSAKPKRTSIACCVLAERLRTPGVGTMSGSYRMVAEDGTEFDAPIPQFVLSVPRVLH